MTNTEENNRNSTRAQRIARGFTSKFFTQVFDFCLITLATLGLWLAFQSSWRKSEIDFYLRELEEPEDVHFSVAIEERDRIHVEAIDTRKPLEFAWKVYLPKGFSNVAAIHHPTGIVESASPVLTAEPIQFIARFKMKPAGDCAVCEQEWMGKKQISITELRESKESVNYIKALDFNGTITQVGRHGMESFGKGDDVVLLMVKVPYAAHLTNSNEIKYPFNQSTCQFRFLMSESILSRRK